MKGSCESVIWKFTTALKSHLLHTASSLLFRFLFYFFWKLWYYRKICGVSSQKTITLSVRSHRQRSSVFMKIFYIETPGLLSLIITDAAYYARAMTRFLAILTKPKQLPFIINDLFIYATSCEVIENVTLSGSESLSICNKNISLWCINYNVTPQASIATKS